MISQGGAFALMSCVGTPNNAGILPMIEDAGIPYVAPFTGASSLRKGARNVFHVRASYTDEVRRLVQRLAGMGLWDIGVVYLDNAYGREMLEDSTRFLADKASSLWCKSRWPPMAEPERCAGQGGPGPPCRRVAGHGGCRFGGTGARAQDEQPRCAHGGPERDVDQ